MHSEKIEALRGKNAGVIAVQASLRSLWTFIGLDQNGNTFWLSPDKKNLPRVYQEGTIALERV
jgi:hypothetical protein